MLPPHILNEWMLKNDYNISALSVLNHSSSVLDKWIQESFKKGMYTHGQMVFLFSYKTRFCLLVLPWGIESYFRFNVNPKYNVVPVIHKIF